jgi:tRNA dimethylallyltransferase
MLLTIMNDPLIVIVGPTAVGKTKVSIELARRNNGEIVSADSRLLYRGMDIGTAKPTKMERKIVPHHLIDVTNPDSTWSLAKYQREAYAAINLIHGRGKIPLLVGGTGLYIKAVIEGWDIPVVKPNQQIREVLEKWACEIGPEGLYNRLSILDPEATAIIDPQNLRRIIRALEVILLTGKPFSVQRKKAGSKYQTLILGITRPRAELYDRIDSRIATMLEDGLVDEVNQLLKDGYSSDLPPLSAIGYKQIGNFIAGQISIDEALILIKRITRNFVRRQANYFKLDNPNIHWFTAGPNLITNMETKIHDFLN